jgi:sugar lactone lactonase YvrE
MWRTAGPTRVASDPRGVVRGHRRGLTLTKLLLPAFVVVAVGLSATAAGAQAFTPIARGDIIASLANGQVNEYSPGGSLVQTVIPNGNIPTGSAFDASGNLYVTEFGANDILKVDGQTGVVSVFSNDTTLADGTAFNSPESIAFGPGYSKIYVSDANRYGPGGGIHVIDPATGKGIGFLPLPSSSGSEGVGESDWLAFSPSADLYMTNENSTQGVMQVVEAAGDIFQPSFIANLPDTGYAISFDPSGDLWLSDTSRILEYGPDGTLVRTITDPSFSTVFSAVFNPPFNTIYAGDLATGNVFTYDLSGNLQNTFNVGSGVDGLSVAGTVIVPPGGPTSISLTPTSVTSPIGKPVTLTALVTDSSGKPVSGITVGFELHSGPDADGGFTPSPVITDASGKATVTLPGYTAGTDIVSAFFDVSEGRAVTSPTASVTFAAQPHDMAATAQNVVVHEGKLVAGRVLATFSDPDGTNLTTKSFEPQTRLDWGDPYFNSLPAKVVATGRGGFSVVPAVPHMFCYTGTHHFTVTIVEPADGESIIGSGTVRVTSSSNHNDNCATGGLGLNGGGCTAAVVSRAGTTPVLMSAAHCFPLNSDGSPKSETYNFVPGGKAQSGAVAPFGDWTGTLAFVNSHFGLSGDRYYDYAFVALNGGCTTSQLVGQCPKIPLTPSVGGLPVRWYPPQSGPLTAINLPWTAYAQLSDPSSCSTPPHSLFSQQEGSGQQWVIEPCNMIENGWPISGAPWIDSANELSSVLSSNGKTSFFGPPVIRGTYLGPEAEADFKSFTSSLP